MFSGAHHISSAILARGVHFALACMLALGLTGLTPVRAAIVNTQSQIWSPEILSGTDREDYLAIFAAQKRGDWKKADQLIGKLEDKRLMGYVLADRYLHPAKKQICRAQILDGAICQSAGRGPHL